ncbi:MAG: hypothetical protein PHS96_13455 [Anaerolineales bacterium]|nr:hypothetical protein [Anaerolineales bacterium]
MSLSRRTTLALSIGLILAGICLRLASYQWNRRLYGDINLFALTARQFALYGRWEYPMKYDYSPNVPYLTLNTPASQHPPLWPLLGGMTARLIGMDDTFSALKGIGLLAGVGLLVVTLLWGARRKPAPELMASLTLLTFSPILVDFSGNASPYVFLAALICLATILLEEIPSGRAILPMQAGLLCAIGYLTHSILLFLPLAFFSFLLRPAGSQLNQMLKRGLLFSLFLVLPLVPWMLWNIQHFGKPLYSYSIYYIFEQLGMLETSVSGDGVYTHLNAAIIWSQVAQDYALHFAKASWALVKQYLLAVGPFALALSLAGGLALYRKQRRSLVALLLPTGLYALSVALWITYKYRFLVPLLPASFLLAGAGFDTLLSGGRLKKGLAWACLLGALAWMVPAYLQPGHSLYYGRETAAQNSAYDRIFPALEALQAAEPGVVLGYSQALDGGIETVYWSRLPFIAGRGLGTAEIRKLATDFRVDYAWADLATQPALLAVFPDARVLARSDPFIVLEVTQLSVKVGGPPLNCVSPMY